MYIYFLIFTVYCIAFSESYEFLFSQIFHCTFLPSSGGTAKSKEKFHKYKPAD
jgi:hypothetical protein